MRAQLSTDQIDHLFDFVRSKYVHYIDVQHELVDHLATAIEEEMAATGVSFEAGLAAVYSRFPVTGFASFVEEKEKAMRRYWRLRQFAYLKTYFTLPKVVMTMAIFLFSWTIFGLDVKVVTASFYGVALLWSVMASASVSNSGVKVKISPLSIVAFVGGMVLAVVGMQWHIWMAVVGAIIIAVGAWLFFKENQLQDALKLREKYLVLASFYGSVWSFGTSLLILPLYGGNFSFISIGADFLIARIFVSIMVTASLVFSHACYTHFRYMLNEELAEKYPHLHIA